VIISNFPSSLIYTNKLAFVYHFFIINSEHLMNEFAASSIHPNSLNLPVCDLNEKEARNQIICNFHNLANATSYIS
jgi:hypothetical protein